VSKNLEHNNSTTLLLFATTLAKHARFTLARRKNFITISRTRRRLQAQKNKSSLCSVVCEMNYVATCGSLLTPRPEQTFQPNKEMPPDAGESPDGLVVLHRFNQKRRKSVYEALTALVKLI